MISIRDPSAVRSQIFAPKGRIQLWLLIGRLYTPPHPSAHAVHAAQFELQRLALRLRRARRQCLGHVLANPQLAVLCSLASVHSIEDLQHVTPQELRARLEDVLTDLASAVAGVLQPHAAPLFQFRKRPAPGGPRPNPFCPACLCAAGRAPAAAGAPPPPPPQPPPRAQPKTPGAKLTDLAQSLFAALGHHADRGRGAGAPRARRDARLLKSRSHECLAGPARRPSPTTAPAPGPRSREGSAGFISPDQLRVPVLRTSSLQRQSQVSCRCRRVCPPPLPPLPGPWPR